MWRPWGSSNKSTVKIHATSSPSLFSCSSFKDIQLLCAEDSSPFSSSSSSSSPSSASNRRTSAVFHRVRLVNPFLRSWPQSQARSLPILDTDPSVSPIPGADNKRIVVYFTSLRVVRSTFEDCRAVRSILRGFRVSVDERDLSMDSGFINELKGILGRKKLSLPRVFIGGRYIGGADEIRQLNESGELKKLIEGLPPAEPGTCDACGGYRFILCHLCNGSHKLYSEKSGFKTCTACNENGLVRCPSCSSAPL